MTPINSLSRCTPTSVETIEVIRVISNRGAGTVEDPIRNVTQYWSQSGDLLAENDPCSPAEGIQAISKPTTF